MKKIAISFLLLAAWNFSFSQAGAKWATGGNGIGTGDYLGTTNNFPILFHTNNTLKMTLGTTGVLNINNLAGTGKRMLQTDPSGNLIFLPAGLTGQFLQSDGTWADLPASATAWKVIGNDVFNTNTGNVGIGTYTPQYKLDVLGDARISNNLYVGGGIVITDKVDASTEVKTGDVIVNGFGTFNGGARFAGVLTATQGIMFDNAGSKGISFTAGTGGSPDVYSFGRLAGGTGPGVNPCFSPVGPTSLTRWEFPGVMQVYSADNTGNYLPGNTILSMSSWGNGSSIDVAGGSPGSLLIDYFCGKDVAICTGTLGGIVSMGNQVSMANSVRIGYDGTNPIDVTTSLNIFNSTKDGLKFITPYNNSKVVSIKNSNFSTSPFTVYGDGKAEIFTNNADAIVVNDANLNATTFKIERTGLTHINIQNPAATDKAFYITDQFYNKDIFLVKSNGKVYAREVEITLVTSFPDYVFNKSYKLTPLSQLDKYIDQNKHLPGFEKGTYYEENGININNMMLKQQEKIEELTLYIIELEKRLNKIENQK